MLDFSIWAFFYFRLYSSILIFISFYNVNTVSVCSSKKKKLSPIFLIGIFILYFGNHFASDGFILFQNTSNQSINTIQKEFKPYLTQKYVLTANSKKLLFIAPQLRWNNPKHLSITINHFITYFNENHTMVFQVYLNKKMYITQKMLNQLLIYIHYFLIKLLSLLHKNNLKVMI